MPFLRKLFISDLTEEPLGHNVLLHQWQNLKDVWNNTGNAKSNAIGIERILRLILIASQFIFPGIYIRAAFGTNGRLHKNLGVEIHVIFKLVIALYILYFKLYDGYLIFWGVNVIKLWCLWMILETIFYTGNLLISEDIFAKPHSDKRNLILIIIDYITINLDFAILYLIGKCLKSSVILNGVSSDHIISSPRDACYFSFISSLTIGYGDISPTEEGRNLVLFHSFIILLFGILFINFYLSRLNKKG